MPSKYTYTGSYIEAAKYDGTNAEEILQLPSIGGNYFRYATKSDGTLVLYYTGSPSTVVIEVPQGYWLATRWYGYFESTPELTSSQWYAILSDAQFQQDFVEVQ